MKQHRKRVKDPVVRGRDSRSVFFKVRIRGKQRQRCEEREETEFSQSCVFAKGAGQPGVQSEWVGTTCFRRLPQKDSASELEPVRYVVQSAQNALVWRPRESRNSDWDGACSSL